MDQPPASIAQPNRPRRRIWWALALISPTVVLAVPYLRHRGGTTDAPALTPLVGQPAPPITGTTGDGHRLDLASYRGRWVLLNFFATWCSGCRDEQSELDALATEHRGGGFSIVSVVYQDTVASAHRYLAAHHATWPLVDDPGGGTAGDYLVQGLPESFVIGPNGNVAAALIGAIHSREVDAIMAQPPSDQPSS